MPNIHTKPAWYLPECEATPESRYYDRRGFLTALGIGGLAMMAPGCGEAAEGGVLAGSEPVAHTGPPSFPHYAVNPSFADAGRPLTCAIGSGKGRDLPVSDAAYFYDGFGIEGETGDWIAVGDGANLARVLRITTNYYQADVLHLDREVEWRVGAPVSLPWQGDAPEEGEL